MRILFPQANDPLVHLLQAEIVANETARLLAGQQAAAAIAEADEASQAHDRQANANRTAHGAGDIVPGDVAGEFSSDLEVESSLVEEARRAAASTAEDAARQVQAPTPPEVEQGEARDSEQLPPVPALSSDLASAAVLEQMGNAKTQIESAPGKYARPCTFS